MSRSNCSIFIKKPWLHEEDQKLAELVMLYGTDNWIQVAGMLPERMGKQCRERWYNHVDPAVIKGDWTVEEDEIIINMQKTIGNQWIKIAKKLAGRSDNSVKNRFHSIEHSRLRNKDRSTNCIHDAYACYLAAEEKIATKLSNTASAINSSSYKFEVSHLSALKYTARTFQPSRLSSELQSISSSSSNETYSNPSNSLTDHSSPSTTEYCDDEFGLFYNHVNDIHSNDCGHSKNVFSFSTMTTTTTTDVVSQVHQQQQQQQQLQQSSIGNESLLPSSYEFISSATAAIKEEGLEVLPPKISLIRLRSLNGNEAIMADSSCLKKSNNNNPILYSINSAVTASADAVTTTITAATTDYPDDIDSFHHHDNHTDTTYLSTSHHHTYLDKPTLIRSISAATGAEMPLLLPLNFDVILSSPSKKTNNNNNNHNDDKAILDEFHCDFTATTTTAATATIVSEKHHNNSNNSKYQRSICDSDSTVDKQCINSINDNNNSNLFNHGMFKSLTSLSAVDNAELSSNNHYRNYTSTTINKLSEQREEMVIGERNVSDSINDLIVSFFSEGDGQQEADTLNDDDCESDLDDIMFMTHNNNTNIFNDNNSNYSYIDVNNSIHNNNSSNNTHNHVMRSAAADIEVAKKEEEEKTIISQSERYDEFYCQQQQHQQLSSQQLSQQQSYQLKSLGGEMKKTNEMDTFHEQSLYHQLSQHQPLQQQQLQLYPYNNHFNENASISSVGSSQRMTSSRAITTATATQQSPLSSWEIAAISLIHPHILWQHRHHHHHHHDNTNSNISNCDNNSMNISNHSQYSVSHCSNNGCMNSSNNDDSSCRMSCSYSMTTTPITTSNSPASASSVTSDKSTSIAHISSGNNNKDACNSFTQPQQLQQQPPKLLAVPGYSDLYYNPSHPLLNPLF